MTGVETPQGEARGAVKAEDHPLRRFVLAELHARPFAPVETGTRILHLGLVTRPGGDALADLRNWCISTGFALPAPDAKHHMAVNGDTTLSWEQHSEFVTISMRSARGNVVMAEPFPALPPDLARFREAPPSTGLLLVAIDLHLVDHTHESGAMAGFDATSLVASDVNDGAALVVTDLKPDMAGFVRFLVVNRRHSPAKAGALVQRLLEIETYRTFSLLGLPEAQRVAPALRLIETTLANIGREMTETEGLEANHRLLDRLTGLAAQLESDAVQSAYRFGASRAYHDIVRQRLAIIGEMPVGEGTTIGAFLDRRLAPAMRTCLTTSERQADLSRKLTRAANLLRTKVDVALESQNRDLLSAMNDRARMQLRLQQTVEGLSVAAISYYVVGLFGYLAKGAKDFGVLALDPGTATGLFVPVAITGVWLAVRRIRRSSRDREF